MDWGDRLDRFLDWTDRAYLVWVGALAGAGVGWGVAVLTGLAALPLAIVGAPIGGALGFLGVRAEDRDE